MKQPLADPKSTGELGRPRHTWRNLGRVLLLLPLCLIAVISIVIWIADTFFGIGIFDPRIRIGPWWFQI